MVRNSCRSLEPNRFISVPKLNQLPGSGVIFGTHWTDQKVPWLQQFMYLRHISAIWIPVKVIVIILLLMGLFQTSVGNVGTADSTIFYFGANNYGQNGQGNSSETDRILNELDVSLLRSVSCGNENTVLLFEDNTLTSTGAYPNLLLFGTSYPEISSVSSIRADIIYSLASNASIYVQGSNYRTIITENAPTFISVPKLTSPGRLSEDIRYCVY